MLYEGQLKIQHESNASGHYMLRLPHLICHTQEGDAITDEHMEQMALLCV